MKDIKYFIWFTMIFGVASQTAWKFIKSYDTVYEAYYELAYGSGRVNLTDKQLKRLNETPLEKAEYIITYCNENDINIISCDSENYPEQFRNLKCPPFVLFYKGDISCISKGNNITCVGTRKPSAYTLKAISEICSELVLNDFTIISGFAVGSDITAHISAINAGCPTVCILGGGIDVNYPKENDCYREEIIKNGGVIISEFLPQAPSHYFNFPKRNILLAALSPVTVVFEAAEKSGSLDTADSAYEQEKTIMCLPPSDILDSRYAGNIGLLRTYAKPLYSIQDIFDTYGAEHKVSVSTEEIPDIPKIHHRKKKKSEKNEQFEQPEETAVKVLPDFSFTPVQKQIIDILESGELHIDVIIEKINMDISELLTEMLELQLAGLIKEMPGSRFAKC